MLTEILGPTALVVTVAGQQLPLERLSTVQIGQGRDNAEDQPDAATCSLTFYGDAVPRLPAVGDGVTVSLGASALTYLGLTSTAATAAAPRFRGHVTDVRATPGAAGVDGTGILQVTATGIKARLGRVTVADTDYPAEMDGVRASRVLAEVAAQLSVTLGQIDPGTVSVLGRTAERTEAMGVLDDLAQECGGVFTVRRDGALEYHDAEHRRNVTANAITLTSANVLRSASWQQSLSGMVNDLTYAYGVGSGNTRPEVRQIDQPSISKYGRLASQVTTDLETIDGAQARLTDLLGRRSRPRWGVEQLELDLARSVTPAVAAQLAQAELGQLILVTGFPSTGPFVTTRMYVEGWAESFSRDGGWRTQLAVTEYALTGPAPRFVDVPDTWTIAGAPEELTILAAAGWYPGEVTPLGRFVDVPANVRISTPANTVTISGADALWS